MSKSKKVATVKKVAGLKPAPSRWPKKYAKTQGAEVDIEGDLNFEDAKVKISIYLDGDLLLGIKAAAGKEGLKYQSYLNALLRKVVLGESTLVEERLAKIEATLERIVKSRAS